jgi:hypothetical protein
MEKQVSPPIEKTVEALEVATEIYAGLRDKSLNKEQAMARVWDEFPKHGHHAEDKAWTELELPKIIDSILTGSPYKMTEDEGLLYIYKCIT